MASPAHCACVCMRACSLATRGCQGRQPVEPAPLLSSFPSPFHLSRPLSPVPPLIPTLSAQRCVFELSDTTVAGFQPLAAISFKITGKLASRRGRLRRRLNGPRGVASFSLGVVDVVRLPQPGALICLFFPPAYSLCER